MFLLKFRALQNARMPECRHFLAIPPERNKREEQTRRVVNLSFDTVYSEEVLVYYLMEEIGVGTG